MGNTSTSPPTGCPELRDQCSHWEEERPRAVLQSRRAELRAASGGREGAEQSLPPQGPRHWSSGPAIPFQALRHQVRLVGIHDEYQLINEVIGLDEAF